MINNTDSMRAYSFEIKCPVGTAPFHLPPNWLVGKHAVQVGGEVVAWTKDKSVADTLVSALTSAPAVVDPKTRAIELLKVELEKPTNYNERHIALSHALRAIENALHLTPPSEPVGVEWNDEAAWSLAARAEAAGAERDSDDNGTWWTLRIDHFNALAQQPAAPSGEAVATVCLVGDHYFATPQQPMNDCPRCGCVDNGKCFCHPPGVDDPIAQLIAVHSELIRGGNEYAYFELAYTRQTGWMAWLTDKPLCAPYIANPDRKVIAKGQGDTPQAACLSALAARQQGGAE